MCREGASDAKKRKPERQIRRTFKPAWRTFRRNFLRLYLTFLLLSLIGLTAGNVSARIAMHSLAKPRVWPMFVLAQLGLFLMLFTRFWQRGAETVLVLDNPIQVPFVCAPAPIVPDLSLGELAPMPGEKPKNSETPDSAASDSSEKKCDPLDNLPTYEI